MLVDLEGQKFGRLSVMKLSNIKDKNGHTYWHCQCDCGFEKVVSSTNLRTGHTRSCGCLTKETPHNLKHGGRRTKEYSWWSSMLARCTNPNSKHYKDYGGRGITVCELWRYGNEDKTGFEHWLDCIRKLGPRPSPKHSIDRINNDGHYEPGNIRWAPWSVQMRNRRPMCTEARANMSNAHLKRCRAPAFRKSISAMMKSKWKDPTYRAAQAERIRRGTQLHYFERREQALQSREEQR